MACTRATGCGASRGQSLRRRGSRGMSEVCLAIEGLTKRFGGFYALNELNMTVAQGAIHALIGPNGAGKTTFFNLVTGVLAADAGRMVFEGTEGAEARPSRRTIRRIARTFPT